MVRPYPQPGHPSHRDPLPESFDRELSRIDAMIGEHALGQQAPAGLTDRLFSASVAELPRTAAPAAPALRLAGDGSRQWSRSRPLHRTLWARFAMAACVALAFIAALRLTHLQPDSSQWSGSGPWAMSTEREAALGIDGGTHYAMNGARAEARPASYRAPLSPNEEMLLLGARAAYLVETRDLTLADLANDFAGLGWDYEG
jgi:hypothetical protein